MPSAGFLANRIGPGFQPSTRVLYSAPSPAVPLRFTYGLGWYGIRPSAVKTHFQSRSTINEYLFPDSDHYGHVSALAGQKAILLDGNLTSDMLLMLNYEREEPRIEILARHGTDLKTLPWQYPHVHAQSDPQGRRISYHSGKNGRADIFLLNL